VAAFGRFNARAAHKLPGRAQRRAKSVTASGRRAGSSSTYGWLSCLAACPLGKNLAALSTKISAGGSDQLLPGAIALTRYGDDGRIEIANNIAERSLRPVVLGRRNYLFAPSDAGGERLANVYSLIGSGMLNAMDPCLYLRRALERIAEQPINRITVPATKEEMSMLEVAIPDASLC
jgi:hypothetical protein